MQSADVIGPIAFPLRRQVYDALIVPWSRTELQLLVFVFIRRINVRPWVVGHNSVFPEIVPIVPSVDLHYPKLRKVTIFLVVCCEREGCPFRADKLEDGYAIL